MKCFWLKYKMAETIIMSIFPFVALSVGPTTIEILHFQFVAGCFISPFAIALTLFFILFICILFYFNVFLFYVLQRCVLITFFSSQLPVRWLNYSSFGFTTRTLQQFVAFFNFFHKSTSAYYEQYKKYVFILFLYKLYHL